MLSPLDHFGTFLYSVWDHAFTLAAGCVVTVVINLIEKHLLKDKKLPLKVDVGILLLFVLFACFQAWHDEYKRAEVLRADLETRPTAPTVQVNVAPAPVNVPSSQIILEQPAGGNTPVSYLEIKSINVGNEKRVIQADRVFAVNIFFEQVGEARLESVRNFATLTVGSEKEETNIVKHFRKQVVAADKRTSLLFGQATGTPVYGRKFYGSAFTPVLTANQAIGILDGTQRLYLNTWASWKDPNGSKGRVGECSWFMKPVSAEVAPGSLALHSCEVQP